MGGNGRRRQLQAQSGSWTRVNDRNSRGGSLQNNTPGDSLQVGNSYAILRQEEIGSVSFLVGDSNVKDQGREFKQRKANRKVLCRPGATVQTLTNQIKKITTKPDDLIIVQVGTENLQAHSPHQLFRSEALLERYKILMKVIKNKTNSNGIITGILPRMDVTNKIHDRIRYINRAVEKIANEDGLCFVNTEHSFDGRPELFHPDGRHLNALGKTQFGILLSNAVEKFHNNRQSAMSTLRGSGNAGSLATNGNT
jgi:hypothetical protein